MIRLTGVTVSVKMMKMSERMPVVRMAKFTGLAPRSPVNASDVRRITGTAQFNQTIALAKRLTFIAVSPRNWPADPFLRKDGPLDWRSR